MTFCIACQAVPKFGYCRMPDCPMPRPKPGELYAAVRVFLDDWRNGDFDLPRLAELDAEAMERALSATYSYTDPPPSLLMGGRLERGMPPEGCYCKDTCGAPSIQGRQMPCLRREGFPLRPVTGDADASTTGMERSGMDQNLPAPEPTP